MIRKKNRDALIDDAYNRYVACEISNNPNIPHNSNISNIPNDSNTYKSHKIPNWSNVLMFALCTLIIRKINRNILIDDAYKRYD